MILLFVSLVQANPLLQATEIEMNRALENLHLEGEVKPYWIGVKLSEGEYQYSLSKNGGLFSSSSNELQQARFEVRVGSPSFDNSNFDSSSNWGTGYLHLPTEDNELALRRELWLGFDRAYKNALEAYSEKEAVFDGKQYPYPLEQNPAAVQQTEFKHYLPVEKGSIELGNQLSSLFLNQQFEDHNVYVYSESSASHYLNTEGFRSSQQMQEIILRVDATIRLSDGSLHRDLRSWVAPNKDSLPSIQELELECKKMIAWLQSLEGAPIEEDYLGPVLFEEQASVELFRQLLQPQLSATPPLQQMPDFDGELPLVIPNSRLGRRVLPNKWTVIDDVASHPELASFYEFDDQGIAPKRVELIKDGVVKNLLMSRIPRKMFTESTGHGRSLGQDREIAIPGTVEIRPDRHSSDRKLKKTALKMARSAGLDYVLVIKRIETLAQTNNFEIAFSGSEQLSGLTLPVESYRLYSDGRKEIVRGLSFVGVDRKVLRDIVLAAKQSPYYTVKDDSSGRYGIGMSSGISVSWSVPSVLIGEMELRGQGGQEQRVVPPPE